MSAAATTPATTTPAAASEERIVVDGERAQMTEGQLNALLELGARRWTRGDKDRLYLSGALDALFDLEVQWYKSGNVSSVSGMSNNQYRRMHQALDGVYINMITGGIGGARSGRYFEQLIDIINQKYRKPNVAAGAAT